MLEPKHPKAYIEDVEVPSFPSILNLSNTTRAEAFPAAVQANYVELMDLEEILPAIESYVKARDPNFDFLRNIHTSSLTIEMCSCRTMYLFTDYWLQTTLVTAKLTAAVNLLGDCANMKRLIVTTPRHYMCNGESIPYYEGILKQLAKMTKLQTITYRGGKDANRFELDILREQMARLDLGIEAEFEALEPSSHSKWNTHMSFPSVT